MPSIPQSTRASSSLPSIAIIGAGGAGLTAALYLQYSEMPCTIYEASKRAGGRIRTAHGLLGTGLDTELGGEFIDTKNDAIIKLAQGVGLEFDDLNAEPTARHDFFIHGRHYKEADIIEAFSHVAAKIKKDFTSLPQIINYKNPGSAGTLDQLSLEEYFHSLGAEPWLIQILNAAYTTEYGLDAGNQSALNFITLVGTDASSGEFPIFGASDERFRILGGNEKLIQEMEKRLTTPVAYEMRLESIKARGTGFTLSFRRGTTSEDVKADIVILTIPFSVLRTIDIKLELPEIKRKSIDELGYGTNAKVLLGLTAAPWRLQGFSGYVFTDESFLTGWESAYSNSGNGSAYTMLIGGTAGVDARDGTAHYQAERHLVELDRIYPGASQGYNGMATRFHWPSYPNTLGCYACYTPGQWTSIGGAEQETVGNLYFAGEHCSYEFQGFMNGAIETGRTAAEAITKRFNR